MWNESPRYQPKHHNSSWNESNIYENYDTLVEPVPKRGYQVQYDEYLVEPPPSTHHHRPMEYGRGYDEYAVESPQRTHYHQMEYQRRYDDEYAPRRTHHPRPMEYEGGSSHGKAKGYCYKIDEDVNEEAETFIKMKHKKFQLSKLMTEKLF